MARDIPEINAGSMADIAFLLLIFFLVTTTMDKDQAYIRSIPKKIETTIPPVPVEQRCIMAIKANNKNQLMVRDEIMTDRDKISERIVEFYTKNEKITGTNINNFPLYTFSSMAYINKKIDETIARTEMMEAEEYSDEMIEFTYSQLAEWEKKKRALKLYGASTLPEVDQTANIRIEVQTATDYGLFSKIHSEIQEGIYELRNKEALRLFEESYAVIEKRFNQDENNEDRQKLDLLEILYPARIIEVTPKQ